MHYYYNNKILNNAHNFLFLQLLDIDPQDQVSIPCNYVPATVYATPTHQGEEDGGHMDLDLQRKGKSAVIKTSTRQVMPNKIEESIHIIFLLSDIFPSCSWVS